MHLLQNFEAAVRENVTINGQPWAETSADSEPNSMYGFSFILPVFIYLFFCFFFKHGIFNWAVLPLVAVTTVTLMKQMRWDSSLTASL